LISADLAAVIVLKGNPMSETAQQNQAMRRIARIQGKPGHAAELRRALIALEAATRKETGCREFAFYQALSTEDSFLLVEEFVDAGALAKHMQLPHTQAFFQAGLTDSIRAEDLP
jgi:quinol monooxygenase YgiN